jgi:tRNA-dihydrouridine synthase
MKLYFAPLEGITTFTYRNTHAEVFGDCDLYYAPFITPTESEKVGSRSFRDILPQNNSVPLCVQMLSSKSTAFLSFCDKFNKLGYTEVNLNLGCPSSTVVKKNRGAGFLRNPELLDSFLSEVFSCTNLEISVKTRTGFYSNNEFDQLLEVYKKYPIKLLIVHPRTREDYYNNSPDICAFKKAYNSLKLPLCYNGNIFSKADFLDISGKFPNLDSAMIGRGAIANPAIFREIKGGKALETSELIDFHNKLVKKYLPLLGSEVYTLHKMKEIWMYAMWNFPDETKILKAVKKSASLADLSSAICCLPEIHKP